MDENNYKEKNEELLRKIEDLKEKSICIQKNFNFNVPDYILFDIIENGTNYNKENINALINLVTINKRISKNNAKVLKEAFVSQTYSIL